jgi:hypothetical protein
MTFSKSDGQTSFSFLHLETELPGLAVFCAISNRRIIATQCYLIIMQLGFLTFVLRQSVILSSCVIQLNFSAEVTRVFLVLLFSSD